MTHLIEGEFQSDKYPTCPRGKVPLSCNDPMAQDLLWEYAKRRRTVDAEFSDDLETALVAAGFKVVVCEWCGSRHQTIMDSDTQGCGCAAGVWQDKGGRWMLAGGYGSTVADMSRYAFVKNAPDAPARVVCDVCIQARIDVGDLELINENYLPAALDALGSEPATEPFDKT